MFDLGNPIVFTVVTVGIIAASAFFVAVEFALIAARKHRLEDAAPESRSARAALRSSTELTVLLAGSQLGITLCVLALGATSKKQADIWLTAFFGDVLPAGVPASLPSILGFVFALIVITFLHLVVGEMAPKSWAIAHPERSAIMLALPMRAFMFVTRPMLKLLNDAANALLHRVGVESTDEKHVGQNPDDLRQLVEHSANVGSLDAAYSRQIGGALELDQLTIDAIIGGGEPTAVAPGATVADVQAASRRTGHLRILIREGQEITGMVHVRDTLALEPSDSTDHLVRPVLELAATDTIHQALTQMRGTSNHLAVVRKQVGVLPGVVTLADVLNRLFPSTDPDPEPVIA